MSARREVVEAVNRERARCVRLVERARAQLQASIPGKQSRAWTWVVLTDHLDRIRRPYAVREAARRAAVPQRLRRSCGLCGGDDHTAPKCHLAGGSPVTWRRP